MEKITPDLVKNAKNELKADLIIRTNNLQDSYTGKLKNNCCGFFIKNHLTDLSVYKQKKASGHNLIVLFRNCVMVGCIDFLNPGKEKLKELKTATDWPVFQLEKLKRITLKNLFSDPFDNRGVNRYKPSCEKTWKILEECFLR